MKQRGGIQPTLRDLAQQSVLRTDGTLVGTDKFGNAYYENKQAVQLRDRWVVYAEQKQPDATTVPGEWHQWLHHVGDAPPPAVAAERKFFQTPHSPNTTGTVYTTPSATYTPHNFLLNKKHGANYTAAPLIEPWQPKTLNTTKK